MYCYNVTYMLYDNNSIHSVSSHLRNIFHLTCRYHFPLGYKIHQNVYLKAHTRGLPKDCLETIRLICIGDVDQNMCCGTHVSNLRYVHIAKVQPTRNNTEVYSLSFKKKLNAQFYIHLFLSHVFAMLREFFFFFLLCSPFSYHYFVVNCIVRVWFLLISFSVLNYIFYLIVKLLCATVYLKLHKF